MARSCSDAAAATASASWLEVCAAARACPRDSVIPVASSALWRPTSATCFPPARFCELVYLVGDHGEPPPVNSRARGLDCGVEREQVRLIRDETNRLGELFDSRRYLTQPPDFGGALLGRGAEVGQLAHRVLGRRAHTIGGFFHL